MNITVAHLLESMEWEQRHQQAKATAKVLPLEPPGEDVDMEITEIIPPARLAVLCARCRSPKWSPK